MNGSKTVLLIVILLMALLPWGLIYYAANSPDGAGLFADGSSANPQIENEIRREEAQKYEALVQRLERQIELLEEKSSALEDRLRETAGDETTVANLKREIEQERNAKERAMEAVSELRRQYDDALSKIVELSARIGPSREGGGSGQNAGDAAEPSPPAKDRQPPLQNNRSPAPPTDAGGWIVPPSN